MSEMKSENTPATSIEKAKVVTSIEGDDNNPVESDAGQGNLGQGAEHSQIPRSSEKGKAAEIADAAGSGENAAESVSAADTSVGAKIESANASEGDQNVEGDKTVAEDSIDGVDSAEPSAESVELIANVPHVINFKFDLRWRLTAAEEAQERPYGYLHQYILGYNGGLISEIDFDPKVVQYTTFSPDHLMFRGNDFVQGEWICKNLEPFLNSIHDIRARLSDAAKAEHGCTDEDLALGLQDVLYHRARGWYLALPEATKVGMSKSIDLWISEIQRAGFQDVHSYTGQVEEPNTGETCVDEAMED